MSSPPGEDFNPPVPTGEEDQVRLKFSACNFVHPLVFLNETIYSCTMNFRYLLALSAIGGLASGLPVIGATQVENPYTPIVTRNIFDLVPIPVVDNTPVVPETPPPKITPNGIMNIFGKSQVLFKVAGVARAGQPPKDESFMLGEGERQDEIEVQKIDQATGTVTFDNHGTIQSLTLSVAANSGVPAPAVGGVPGVTRPIPTVTPAVAASKAAAGFGGRFGRPETAPATAPDTSTGAGAATTGGNAAPAEQITPEAQVIIMEAQRAKWKNEGNPAAAILPPTAITDMLNDEGGGGPPAPPGLPGG
jgi:hypothetical protein